MHVDHLAAENLTGPVAHHAEGPVWSSSWGGLRFVDLSAGDLLTVRHDGVIRMHTGRRVASFVRPRSAGGYVVGTESGIGLSDHDDEPPSRFVDFFADPQLRMNDGATDPHGALFAGSMDENASAGRGSLFRLEADLSWRVAVGKLTISNGMAFSPDGVLAYFADSATGRIDVFDYVDRELKGRRPFVSFKAEDGQPDGLTVAADGSVWVALWGGSSVRGYAASGELLAIIDVPATHVSACTFGGLELGELYITTSRQGLGAQQQPQAGSVFVAEVGASGIPVVPFLG